MSTSVEETVTGIEVKLQIVDFDSIHDKIATAAAAQGTNARGREGNDNGPGNDSSTRGCRELPSYEQLRQALTTARARTCSTPSRERA